MRAKLVTICFVIVILLLFGMDESEINEVREIHVPGGEFVMGSSPEQIKKIQALCRAFGSECPDSWFESETPQHKVTLSPFSIDETEVSVEQFLRFLNTHGNKCVTKKCFEDLGNENFIRKEGKKWVVTDGYQVLPITDVTWEGADAYCRWKGKRLPSEAQWEKAARGENGRIFPWGDDWVTDNANFCDINCPEIWGVKKPDKAAVEMDYDDQSGKSAPVASYPQGKSPYGLHNMAGNAWEWCADVYLPEAYAKLPEKDPIAENPGTRHVLRGGGWNAMPFELRSAARFREGPGRAVGARGFRCVRIAK